MSRKDDAMTDTLTPHDWLWQTLAAELGADRAEAIRVEYQQRKRRTSQQTRLDQARRELPALREKLKAALRTTKTPASDIKKLREMIASRERKITQADATDDDA